MLFSNELNYWVIKKNAKKDLLLRMGAPYQSRSQNLKRNQFQSFHKFVIERSSFYIFVKLKPSRFYWRSTGF
ncbi:hypothetical protein [Leptospira borgpetersenii]|uniref:hypothetical protein n=1 Tax=Leptospira borgpetersenii TaxID=174 RepID=UPI0009B7C199